MDIELGDVDDAAQRLRCTRSAVRRMIFDDTNGFASKCVVRMGRRVRIRLDRLNEFIDERTGAPPFQHSNEWRKKIGRPKAKRRAKGERKRRCRLTAHT